ncbi:MAG: OmpA family protein [Chitinophagales bacterium]|nr:OmpA family protein [Chitinophagales bacterium]
MKKNISIYTLFLLLILSVGSKAQDATNSSSINKANEAYNNLNYADAIPLYNTYLKKNSTDADAYAKLGDCYKLTLDFENAKEAYANATLNKVTSADYVLKYAEMLHATGNYDKALAQYQNYLVLNENGNQIVSNQIKVLENIDNYASDKNRFSLQNLDFNSAQYDFSPVLYKDGLIYTSSKGGSGAIKNTSAWTGISFFNMYFVEGSNLNFKDKSSVFFSDKNTKLHDGVIAFLPNQEQFYYTRNNYYDGKVKTAKNLKPTQNMYLANVDGSEETPFEFNSDDYNVGQPTLSSDGNTMYFVSDMPGGFGGKDIYVTTKEDGKWSTPKNLGNKINTAGDEMFPFLYKDDKSFYFSSDGLGGLGGLDVFRTTIENGSVATVRNMKSPINSAYDDFGIYYGNARNIGYLSSNRSGGKGLDDIYAFKDAGIYYEGLIVDADTKQPICNSTVQLLLDNESINNYTTDCNGDFVFDVTASGNYCFNATAQGYYPNTKTCRNIEDMTAGETIYDTIYMNKVKPVSVSVQAINSETKQAIPNAKVEVNSSCEKKIELQTNSKGEVCFEVKCDCDYSIALSAKDYTANQINYSPKNDCESLKSCGEKNGKVLSVNLQPVKKETIKVEDIFDNISDDGYIELKGIYYDLNKWNIRPESEVELNKLLTFLNGNPDAIVEIASHTDSRGSSKYNQTLSQKRAQSVVEWLMAHNISKDRLYPKGYGETKLKNKCADGVTCTEAEHQLNRRTEFKVISVDNVIESKP